MTTTQGRTRRPAHELTPRQYHAQVLRETMAEFGCTRREAEEQFPRFQTDTDHERLCYAFARFGGTVPSRVLDKLSPITRRGILHDWYDQHTEYLRRGPRRSLTRDLQAETQAEKGATR